LSAHPARRLAVEDATVLAALEERYPEAMRQGEAGWRARLDNLARSDESLSWIIEDDEGPLGYLVAWRGRSMVDVPRPEQVIFIDDLQAVKPAVLYPLLQALAADLDAKGWLALPIEGVCRRNAYRVFREHDASIRRLGWELHATYEYWDDELGEELCWMRWRALRAAPPSTENPVDAWVPTERPEGVSEWDSFTASGERDGDPPTLAAIGAAALDYGPEEEVAVLREVAPEDLAHLDDLRA
jgi:hypothetical protein